VVQYDNSSDHHANHITQRKDNPKSLYVPCKNAINCGRSIIKILDQAINPILNQYGYPEMSVRIGIDIGENVVVQDGWDIHKLQQPNTQGKDETVIIREPDFDIIGYSTNIAVKMTGLASANKFVIGQSTYDILDYEKSSFKLLDVNPKVWKYIDDRTDALYRIYQSN
jgi:adenylate cyclase